MQQRPVILLIALFIVAIWGGISSHMQLQYFEYSQAQFITNDDLADIAKRLPLKPGDSAYVKLPNTAYFWALTSVYTAENYKSPPEKSWAVFSVDSYDSFLPAERWKQLGTWTIDNNGSIGAHFYRPPAYSLVYLGLRTVLSVNNTYRGLVVINLLAYVFIAFLCYQLAGFMRLRFEWRILALLLFGLFPGFAGYIPVLLPEVLSLMLVMALAYCTVRAWQNPYGRKSYLFLILAGGSFIGAVYCRPQTLLMGLVFLPLLWRIAQQRGFALQQIVLAGACMAILPLLLGGSWTLRNYQLSGQFIPINNYNYPDLRYRSKPEFMAYLDFVRVSGVDGSRINDAQLPLYSAALLGDTAQHYREAVFQQLETKVIHAVGKQRIDEALRAYQRVIYEKYSPAHFSAQPLPNPLSKEQLAVRDTFNSLTRDAYAKLPMQRFKNWGFYAKNMLLHSFTSNVWYVQPNVRSQSVALRLLHLLCFAFNFSLTVLWLFSYISLFWRYKSFNSLQLVMFYAVPLLFLIFMVTIYQANEQRYIYPFVGLIVVVALEQINYWYKRLQFSFAKSSR